MKKIGFDCEQYRKLQSENIKKRIGQFGDKLYLEFGGKLFDDYHASRVLPGFEPDSKLKMLLELKDQAEIVIVISAGDIERNKVREDLEISYQEDVLRLRRQFMDRGLYVGGVVITQYSGQKMVDQYRQLLEKKGIRVYFHYVIQGYPSNIPLILSEDGFGRNDYIETSRPLVVVTAPGPGSGKMATCLSQIYHENKRGVKAGYAKFETFPIWNLPLKHPVNIAYEAATADLNDLNVIDPFHLEAYGTSTVNYNRDVAIFPVLSAMFEGIYGESPYRSPTDMGVNMAGRCIVDDDVCCEASRQEIIRRYYHALCDREKGKENQAEIYRLELIMRQAKVTCGDRSVVPAALKKAEDTNGPAAALELPDGRIITGKTTELLGACATLLLNAMKVLAEIPDPVRLLSPNAILPIQDLKIKYLGSRNPRLHTDETLIALSSSAYADYNARSALEQLPVLRGCQAHVTVTLSEVDQRLLKKLGIEVTTEPVRESTPTADL